MFQVGEGPVAGPVDPVLRGMWNFLKIATAYTVVMYVVEYIEKVNHPRCKCIVGLKYGHHSKLGAWFGVSENEDTNNTCLIWEFLEYMRMQ